MLPQIRSAEVPIAEAMLQELIAVSETMTAVDEDDVRLEGKLNLLLELITVLDRRHVGTAGNGNLVHRIITGWRSPLCHRCTVKLQRQHLTWCHIPDL